MSVQKVNVLVPPLRPVPPGAAWAANAVAWLFVNDPRRPGLAAWLAQARARRRVARAERRQLEERLALLALARRYEQSQPEFAKDLAAAARADRPG
jgi:hypothetical protein